MLKISTVSYQEKSMDNYNNNGYDNGYNNNDNRNNNRNNNNNNKKPKNVNLIIFIIIAAVVTFIGLTLLSNMFRNATYKEISYDQFMQMIDEDKVKKVALEQDRILITPVEEEKQSGIAGVSYTYYTGYVNDDTLVPLLKRKGIEFEGYIPDSSSSIVEFLLAYVLPFLFIYIIFAFVYRRIAKNGGMMGGMGVGKSNAKVYVQKKTGVTFKDVAGQDEAKESLTEIVDFLHYPEKYAKIGAKLPKGALLVGPPGTGKTLLAKAVAGEADVPFFSLAGSDFVEMFVGVGASRVRDMFEEAKKNAPCIIFIDEIDAVARRRGTGMGGGHDEREQTLNQMLVEMDGFGVNEGIIVMAATNRVDILDPAILRPGRFDRKVVVGRPDVRGRLEILNVHAAKKPLGDDVDLDSLARTTAGFTGADLENILNEAAINAAKSKRKFITNADVNYAFVKVGIGVEKRSKIISEKEKKITAYHESGHAILFHVLPDVGPVHTISIIPTGMGAAVVFVMTIASFVTSVVYYGILRRFGLEYLNTIVFILVIAALVQFVEMFLKKSVPALYKALGVYLPLITTNCAVLGVVLVNVQKGYNFLLSVVNGAAGGLGFTVAIVLFASVRERVNRADCPACFKGFPIALISAGLLALAFMGFSGLKVF